MIHTIFYIDDIDPIALQEQIRENRIHSELKKIGIKYKKSIYRGFGFKRTSKSEKRKIK